jgi:hypothetical protein
LICLRPFHKYALRSLSTALINHLGTLMATNPSNPASCVHECCLPSWQPIPNILYPRKQIGPSQLPVQNW